jgi:hypothetical protein
MLAEEQREQFKNDVAQLKLKSGGSRYDGPLRILGGILMLVGVVAAFIIYEASLSQKDARNIASQQILAIGFLGITLIGVALFVAASLAQLLRLWLLRQLYENQSHVDQLVNALGQRGGAAWPDRTGQATDAMR